MELIIKKFNELDINELYEILKLRVDVFVVEQNCAYPEVDGKDLSSYHVYLKDEEGIQAYLRVLDKGVSYDDVSIGRVISKKRRSGLGTQLIQAGIDVAKNKLDAKKIKIEAQTYAKTFYENVGFVQSSEEFLEDGIPHIEMILEIK
ncbi:GNAT family N-acetyltransferase [Anaerorhabdus sp.]|uniref:GNAT family N-acetyltransferase n=1 Tax=Anaerorhabdus sp. TaxID=1872524 RepID=UPI002FC7AF94